MLLLLRLVATADQMIQWLFFGYMSMGYVKFNQYIVLGNENVGEKLALELTKKKELALAGY